MIPTGLRDVLAGLAALGITAAACVTGAFWLFKLLADKWLWSRFNTQLETYKHAQQKELEKLKLEINTQLDRVTKLDQHV